jgi:hypothetical protein
MASWQPTTWSGFRGGRGPEAASHTQRSSQSRGRSPRRPAPQERAGGDPLSGALGVAEPAAQPAAVGPAAPGETWHRRRQVEQRGRAHADRPQPQRQPAVSRRRHAHDQRQPEMGHRAGGHHATVTEAQSIWGDRVGRHGAVAPTRDRPAQPRPPASPADGRLQRADAHGADPEAEQPGRHQVPELVHQECGRQQRHLQQERDLEVAEPRLPCSRLGRRAGGRRGGHAERDRGRDAGAGQPWAPPRSPPHNRDCPTFSQAPASGAARATPSTLRRPAAPYPGRR